jgi:hypothetical protein
MEWSAWGTAHTANWVLLYAGSDGELCEEVVSIIVVFSALHVVHGNSLFYY